MSHHKRATNFTGGPQTIHLNKKPPFKVPFRFKNSAPNKEKTLQNESMERQKNPINNNDNNEPTISLMSISLPNISPIVESTTQDNSNLLNTNQNSLGIVSGNRVSYNPQVNIFNKRWYSGPYSINCMINARRYLIEKLSPHSTGMILPDKLSRDEFELLKLKCITLLFIVIRKSF